MTKREQIIEIIRRHQVYRLPLDKKDYEILNNNIVDEILVLREIDVPTDADIEAWADSKERRLTSYHKGLQDGAKAMRDGEIIKKE